MPYRIGTSTPLDADDNCETLFGVDPRSTYSPGGARVANLDGTTSDVGYERVTWTYAALTIAQWTALKTLVGGFSGTLYIETRNDVDTFDEYSVIARLPNPSTLRRWGGKYINIVIDFVLIEAT